MNLLIFDEIYKYNLENNIPSVKHFGAKTGHIFNINISKFREICG